MPTIRQFTQPDWSDVWRILQPVFRAGETYPVDPQMNEQHARDYWVGADKTSYVALASKKIVGSYYIKANQMTLGAHVCNCGYVVATSARSQGIASAMCIHSQKTAIDMGFLAMQFNMVVISNHAAVKLWKKLGFAVIGQLPRAFRHQQLGLVDALIMYKWLDG